MKYTSISSILNIKNENNSSEKVDHKKNKHDCGESLMQDSQSLGQNLISPKYEDINSKEQEMNK